MKNLCEYMMIFLFKIFCIFFIPIILSYLVLFLLSAISGFLILFLFGGMAWCHNCFNFEDFYPGFNGLIKTEKTIPR